MKNEQLFEKITSQIVEAIESGKLRKWEPPYTNGGLARNFFTGHTYTGVNFLMFNFCNNDSVKLYGTQKQIIDAGAL
jgi:antirestriction protein ArdC